MKIVWARSISLYQALFYSKQDREIPSVRYPNKEKECIHKINQTIGPKRKSKPKLLENTKGRKEHKDMVVHTTVKKSDFFTVLENKILTEYFHTSHIINHIFINPIKPGSKV